MLSNILMLIHMNTYAIPLLSTCITAQVGSSGNPSALYYFGEVFKKEAGNRLS
jgi:hypothetical protein